MRRFAGRLGDNVGGSRIRGRVDRLRGVVVVVGGMVVGGKKIVKIEKRRKGIELGRIYQVGKGIG